MQIKKRNWVKRIGNKIADFFNSEVSIRRGYAFVFMGILYAFTLYHKIDFKNSKGTFFWGLFALVSLFILFGGPTR